MNKKYSNLIEKLQKTLEDPEVKSNEELNDTLTSYKNKLENGKEYRLVCTKLTNAITTYLRHNNFKAPKSVLDLYNGIAKGASEYRGIASFITWF
ncbi:bacteriocin immunity protein [Clostridium oceanicum]|uniref:Bacteriocin immunity protein n=1 Tax=Clostridium oceanicum TaxID=1543 RepID=A0ABN1JXQ1_9CLOT